MAGYAFAWLDFPGRDWLFVVGGSPRSSPELDAMLRGYVLMLQRLIEEIAAGDEQTCSYCGTERLNQRMPVNRK